MRVLLDTHAFLWAHADPNRLGDQRPVVENEDNELLVSAASSWEIAIKANLGRLTLPEPVSRWVPDRIVRLGAIALPVEHSHALAVAELPPVHRDPFDRLLVAQSKLLGVPVLTADPVFATYGIEVLAIS